MFTRFLNSIKFWTWNKFWVVTETQAYGPFRTKHKAELKRDELGEGRYWYAKIAPIPSEYPKYPWKNREN